jgi:hypothetical protein
MHDGKDLDFVAAMPISHDERGAHDNQLPRTFEPSWSADSGERW